MNSVLKSFSKIDLNSKNRRKVNKTIDFNNIKLNDLEEEKEKNIKFTHRLGYIKGKKRISLGNSEITTNLLERIRNTKGNTLIYSRIVSLYYE